MSAESALLVRSWPVGSFTATLTLPRATRGEVRYACIEWTPHIPQRLTEDELAQYRSGRNAAFESLGMRAMVIDL